MELAKATGLPIYTYETDFSGFPNNPLPSNVIDKISRMDPCPQGVLVNLFFIVFFFRTHKGNGNHFKPKKKKS